MHTTDSNFSNFVIEYLSEIATKFEKNFTLFIRGPDGFESWKKIEFETLVTHSL